MSTWQRAVAALSVVATSLTGVLSLFVLLALLPHNYSRSSAIFLLAQKGLTWLVLPLIFCVLAIVAGRACIALGRPVGGTAIIALPLLAAPVLFLRSLA